MVIEGSYELWGQIGLVLLIISFRYYESVLETNAKNQAIESISKHPKADYVVMREGVRVTVPEDELLIGDLIYLKPGVKVPVDGIMVRGNTLKVSERYVYGEAHPLPKKTPEQSTPLKSSPFLFAESHVSSGTGWMISLSIG